MRFRSICVALLGVTTAAAAAPAPAPAQQAPPSPAEWWTKPPDLPEAADPLGARGLGPGDSLPTPPRGYEASYYRLWGLYPLQNQVVRRGEAIIEIWMRPEQGGREAVVRITLRQDGRAFVQARAGYGCCAPSVLKRVDIDAELDADQAARARRLVGSEVWLQPENVYVDEGAGALEPVCLGGRSYDLYRVERGASAHLRRDCGAEEIGSAAALLAPALALALGRDARFDDLFARSPAFQTEAAAWEKAAKSGARLAAVKPRT